MTIAELAGPVLLSVLPTTIGVLLATCCAMTLPFVLPRFVTWLKGPAPAAHAHGHGHGASPHPHAHLQAHTHHEQPHHHAAHAQAHETHEHTYHI